ncbi:MAG: hypothetical protein VX278_06845 [Myxococcota bacterium]|nr:hypothetical protein [Myxococcota bacterium]
MKKILYSLSFIFAFLPKAHASKNALSLEFGAGHPFPLCLQLDILQEDFCGPGVNPRLATRLEWRDFSPDGRFYPVFGVEYRRIVTDAANLGIYVASDEVLLTAQVVNVAPRSSGRYFRGGFTLGLIRSGRLTMAMMEGLDCEESCSQLGSAGKILIPLTPLAGLASGLGLEFGGGYQWEGFSTGLHVMTDFFLFSVEIRTSYQFPL